jgi:hypothetical protein
MMHIIIIDQALKPSIFKKGDQVCLVWRAAHDAPDFGIVIGVFRTHVKIIYPFIGNYGDRIHDINRSSIMTLCHNTAGDIYIDD